MKKIAMIPARYAATRFPAKLMQLLKDKTVIRHTYDNTVATNLFDEVMVVTDSEIIFNEITQHGGKAIMSIKQHESGSDRIAEAIVNMHVDIVVKEEDAAEAKKILQQFDEEYLQSVKCPQCGAGAITLVSKPGVKNFVTAILTWAFSDYAVAAESIYQCGKCGYESKTMPITINEDDLHE